MGGTTLDKELRPGVEVAIHGLKGAAELNGKSGKVETWDADKGRWTVRLPSGELKALKPENLQPKKFDSTPWILGAVGVIVLAVILQQIDVFGQMGLASPVAQVKELFEPFVPPPPKAPADTVVISFCQG